MNDKQFDVSDTDNANDIEEQDTWFWNQSPNE